MRYVRMRNVRLRSAPAGLIFQWTYYVLMKVALKVLAKLFCQLHFSRPGAWSFRLLKLLEQN